MNTNWLICNAHTSTLKKAYLKWQSMNQRALYAIKCQWHAGKHFYSKRSADERVKRVRQGGANLSIRSEQAHYWARLWRTKFLKSDQEWKNNKVQITAILLIDDKYKVAKFPGLGLGQQCKAIQGPTLIPTSLLLTSFTFPWSWSRKAIIHTIVWSLGFE